MSNFESSVLTKKGIELLVNAVAGKKINFTRMVVGSGIYSAEEKTRSKLEKAEGLKEKRQEFPITRWTKPSETSVLLKALISNKTLTAGYRITEIGIYGKEDRDSEDFLCSIAVVKSLEESDFLPPYNGLRECQIVEEYYLTLSPDLDVTINSQGAVALVEDFEQFKIEMEALFTNMDKVIIGPADYSINSNEILLVSDGVYEEYSDTGIVIYFGASSKSTLTAAEIQALTEAAQPSNSFSFRAVANAGAYIFFACPASAGSPTFYVDGWEGGFFLSGTVSMGEAYRVYRSDQPGLGVTDVDVVLG